MAPSDDRPGAAGRREDQGRSDDRFQRVFQRYYQPVYSFFRRRGFAEDDSRDLTQETFLRVLTSLGGLRSADSEGTWVLRVAANVWKNELRRRSAGMRAGKEVSLDLEMSRGEAVFDKSLSLRHAQAPDPFDQALAKESFEATGQGLREMPPQMRRCLLLHAVQGRKYREIADLLQISIETVKSHIHQARHRLKKGSPRKGVSSG